MVQKVHVGIVLDRSGSMEDCRTDAIGAINGYLRQIREDRAMEAAAISLMIFDSQSIDVIRDKVPARDCEPLASGEYQPRAQTPLLDAVGHGVALLDRRKEAGERCILAIMTDGLENASREYNLEAIRALLHRQQEEDGWLIIYLGADHEAWKQASAMGLRAGNTSGFSKAAFGASMAGVAARARRYATATDAADEAAAGGFIEEERDAMRRPPPRGRRPS